MRFDSLGSLGFGGCILYLSQAAPLEHRWVYLATNLLVDKNIKNALVLLDRAAKVGYNGVVLTDSKFLRWDQLPERYLHQRPPGPPGPVGTTGSPASFASAQLAMPTTC